MVIKVGMVGDSQIGKTSLMVKYVEGSFDEDYIQTLGRCVILPCNLEILSSAPSRRQLHGEDNLRPTNHDHFFNLGFGWPARICQHAAPCL